MNMKICVKAAIIGALSALTLTGCGGGGGGGSAPTKAVSTVYLFGSMSSNSIITSVQTVMTVPSGILVNYTSPAGATSGTWPLRNGAVVASGPFKVNNVSGSLYDIASRKLSINLVNGAFLNLSSSKTKNSGKGNEIATLNFTLAKPGVTPVMPLNDPAPIVGKQLPGPTVGYLNGCITNFFTVYQ